MKKLTAMRDSLLINIHKLMNQDKSIYFLTADFGSPIIDKIKSDYSNRIINVGIAEQNLINIASGLALEGNKVFAYAIAPFITMRCYEQIRVNLALLSKIRKLNVTLIGVGAGYSYPVSGPTHQCYEDISIMRTIPNIEILSFSDEVLISKAAKYCLGKEGIKYLRLDAQILPIIHKNNNINYPNGFSVISKGKNILIISTGYLVHNALKIKDHFKKINTEISVIDLYNLTNFSEKKLMKEIVSNKKIISIEEGFVGRGGLDSILLNLINKYSLKVEYKIIGVNPKYNFSVGSRDKIHEKVGVGLNKSIREVKKFIEEEN